MLSQKCKEEEAACRTSGEPSQANTEKKSKIKPTKQGMGYCFCRFCYHKNM